MESDDTGPPGQRDDHIKAIANDGRLKWQVVIGYGKRALTETAIRQCKGLISRRLRAGSLPAQQIEVAIGCAVLNRMTASARPKSVRRSASNASQVVSRTRLCRIRLPRTKARLQDIVDLTVGDGARGRATP
jgi:hypothetical protein